MRAPTQPFATSLRLTVDQVQRPEVVALNKIDALLPEQDAEQVTQLKTVYDGEPLLISGVTRVGVKKALSEVSRHLGLIAEEENAGEDADWTPL